MPESTDLKLTWKAIERLKAGERFNVVAGEMSEDKAKAGGSLGWQTRAQMIGSFSEAAFQLQPSTTERPIYTDPPLKTKFGYHVRLCAHRNVEFAVDLCQVIMVEGRKI